MFRTVNRLIALSLGTHREQFEHLTGSETRLVDYEVG